jgi:excisionase family DNA binding protein
VNERLLTARDLAERLAVSPETILRWMRRGQLPAVKMPGGAVRFRPEAIDSWLGERTTGAVSGEELSTTRHDRAQRGGYAAIESSVSTTLPQLEAAPTEEDHHAR